MSECSSLLVNRTPQIQCFYDSFWCQTEMLTNKIAELCFIHLCCSKWIYKYTDRISNTDCICKLNLNSFAQSCCYKIFRNVSRHVTSRAINFRWIFTGESSTTMRGHSAVSINNNFAAG